MKTIKTTAELLALRDTDGVIRIEDDCRIECDVPWAAGKDILGMYVRGNLDADGYLHVRGSLHVDGSLDVGGCLYAR